MLGGIGNQEKNSKVDGGQSLRNMGLKGSWKHTHSLSGLSPIQTLCLAWLPILSYRQLSHKLARHESHVDKSIRKILKDEKESHYPRQIFCICIIS